MIESKRLFTSIIQNKYLIKTEIILFLNKKDVFIEKFGRGDFKKYVKKYTGPDDEPDKAIEHLKINVFEEVRSFYKVNFKKHVIPVLFRHTKSTVNMKFPAKSERNCIAM